MGIVKNVKMIDVDDWDKLVIATYKRPYKLQQQEGCRGRGMYRLIIPSDYTEDKEMNDTIPEKINGEIMGVKFNKWLNRDPDKQIGLETSKWSISLFWERNFYPCTHTVANDLYKKGLIEAGSYIIDIDW